MSRAQSSSTWLRPLAIVLVVVGLVLLVTGIVYFTVPAGKLPALLGRIPNSTAHRTKRGTAGLVAGIACWIGAGIALSLSRRR